MDDESDSLSREPSPCDENCENITSVPCDPISHPLVNCESEKVTVATQTGHEAPDLSFNPDKMTLDKHCYECKVRYRDPKPQDLVMYLHAWKYKVRIDKFSERVVLLIGEYVLGTGMGLRDRITRMGKGRLE